MKMKIQIKPKLNKLIKFLKEVKIEMKRVDWLGFKQTIQYTVIVILVSVVVAVFLGGIDFLFSGFLKKFIL